METLDNSAVKSAKDMLSSFLLCNIRSLKHKVDELQTVTQINEVAVVAVTETWLKETVPDSIVSLQGRSPCPVYKGQHSTSMAAGH